MFFVMFWASLVAFNKKLSKKMYSVDHYTSFIKLKLSLTYYK